MHGTLHTITLVSPCLCVRTQQHLHLVTKGLYCWHSHIRIRKVFFFRGCPLNAAESTNLSPSFLVTSQWRHNEHDGLSNHRRFDCLLNDLFRCWSKKASKFRVTGLCVGNSQMTGEFPAQRGSNAGNVSILWRHHEDCVHQTWFWMVPQACSFVEERHLYFSWGTTSVNATCCADGRIRYRLIAMTTF